MIGPIVKHGSSSAASSPLDGSLPDRLSRPRHSPPPIRLTISESDALRPGRIAASGERAAHLLNSTLPGAFRLKAEGYGVSGKNGNASVCACTGRAPAA